MYGRKGVQKVGSYRREPNKSNSGVTSLGNIEAFSGWSSRALRRDELASELGQLGLQDAKMVRGLWRTRTNVGLSL